MKINYKKYFYGVFALFALAFILVTGCSKDSTTGTNTTPSIIIATPSTNAVIEGGTQNFQISWSGTGIASSKTIEYSLDNGVNWSLIGNMNADVNYFNWNVPNVATTKALIRITDANGLKGTSGIFTITFTNVLAVGEMDATVGSSPFKSINGKAINGTTTVTVKASLKKQGNTSLDSVSITMIIGKQGAFPYTIDLASDASSQITFCVVNPSSGTCASSFTAKNGSGSGKITITNLTPIIEGTFSGTLPEVGGSGSLTITNGSFKAQLN